MIERILNHIGVPSVPPEIAPSRGPPANDNDHYIGYDINDEPIETPDYDLTSYPLGGFFYYEYQQRQLFNPVSEFF